MEKNYTYEREISIRQLILRLLTKVKIIVMVGIILAILINGYKLIPTFTKKEKVIPIERYVSTAKIFLGSDTDTETAAAIRTYLISNDVLQDVISDAKLDWSYNDLYNTISLQNSTDSIIVINVYGTKKELIQTITKSLQDIGIKKISEKFHNNKVELLETAYTVKLPNNTDNSTNSLNLGDMLKQLFKYAVIGFILGALLASGIYLVLFMVDNTIREEKEVEGYLGLPILGTIPTIEGTGKLTEKGKKNKKLRLIQYSA